MLNKILFNVLFLVLCQNALSAQRGIAIPDLTPQGLNASEAAIISDRLRGEVVQKGNYRVMERSLMDEILKEQGFQSSGACDTGACSVEMGRLLGVDEMLVGSVGKLGNTYTLETRLISVESGQVLASFSESSRNDIDEFLQISVPQLANKLVQWANQRDGGKLQASTATTPTMGGAKFWTRIGLGIAALGAMGFAINREFAVRSSNTNIKNMQAQYKDSQTAPQVLLSLHKKIPAEQQKADDASVARNVGLGVASIFALGFAVTFAF